MKPAEKQIGSKATRYVIGASILMLALMLFSELSCSLLGLCTNWFPLAEIIGFWEMLGISTALLFASFSVRALRRGREPQITSNPGSVAEIIETESSPADDPEALEPSPPKRTSRWRDLFNQLSEEEKQNLKTIMEEHCIPPDRQSTGRPSTTESKG